MPKRNMWLAAKRTCTNIKKVTLDNYYNNVPVRTKYTQFYTTKKEEITKSPKTYDYFSKNPKEISEHLKKELESFDPHPKWAMDSELKDKTTFSHFWVASTHKIPSEKIQQKYKFKVLASTYLGKDPEGKYQFAIITDRKMTLQELNSMPVNKVLTEYWKSKKDFQQKMDKLFTDAKSKVDAILNQKSNTMTKHKKLEQIIKEKTKIAQKNSQLDKKKIENKQNENNNYDTEN